jgi:large subunit ribosomal protein L25
MTDFTFKAQTREDIGTSASRRLRHQGEIPAVLIDKKEGTQCLTFSHDKIFNAFENNDIFSSIVTLKVGRKSHSTMISDVQRHPYKRKILHVDFTKVDTKQALSTSIPLNFIGEEDAPFTEDGRHLNTIVTEIEISCLPKDLPHSIEIDVSSMTSEDTIQLSAIVVPAGVTITGLDAENPESDITIAMVSAPHKEQEESEEDVDAAEEDVDAAAEDDKNKSDGDE